MKRHDDKIIRFAVCVTDSEPDLERRKVYQVLPDKSADQENYLRVMDESGEDYLYPASYFVLMELPQTAETTLLSAF
jgi:hypothetical protein